MDAGPHREGGLGASVRFDLDRVVGVVEVHVHDETSFLEGADVLVDRAHGVDDFGRAAGIVPLASVGVVVASPAAECLRGNFYVWVGVDIGLGDLAREKPGAHQPLDVVVALGMRGITRHPQGEPGGRARGFGVGQEIARLVEEARLAHIVGDPAAFIDQRGDAGPVRAHHCIDVFGLVGLAAEEQQAAQGVQVGLAVADSPVRQFVGDGAVGGNGVLEVKAGQVLG